MSDTDTTMHETPVNSHGRNTTQSSPAIGSAGGTTQDPRAPPDDGYRHFQRIRVLPGDSDTAASFEFTNEDHTLGNALRHIIIRNPDVEFCGYSVPHPSDPKMTLRIQTNDEVTVYDVLEKGLNELMEVCDVVLDKFEQAQDEFPKSS